MSTSMNSLNSSLNPVIYSIRIRQFRFAFIELTCRTVNIAEAEEIEMRLFETPNVVVTLEAGQELERQVHQNMEQENVNNDDNYNSEVLPQVIIKTLCVDRPRSIKV